jgi:phage tail protein X
MAQDVLLKLRQCVDKVATLYRIDGEIISAKIAYQVYAKEEEVVFQMLSSNKGDRSPFAKVEEGVLCILPVNDIERVEVEDQD